VEVKLPGRKKLFLVGVMGTVKEARNKKNKTFNKDGRKDTGYVKLVFILFQSDDIA
jgi:hypothetical protein